MKTSSRWFLLHYAAQWLILATLLCVVCQSNALSLCRSSFTQSDVVFSQSSSAVDSFSACGSEHNFLIMMGKGDGKKKRKPKKKAVEDVVTPKSPPPQRVSTDINIPVKHQIRWGKIKKEAAKYTGVSFRQKKVVRTSYRRTWDEEEIELKREERARKGKDPDWSIILNETVASPLVIVDGYNIIYKWSRLKKYMTKGDTARARQLLVDDLESLRALKGWRIECVFDGAAKSSVGPLGYGPGGLEAVKSRSVDSRVYKDVSKYGVRVVFTGSGVEADSYIEKRCREAKNVTNGAITRSFIVATDDGMIRLAGLNAGALCMSASRFLDELKAVRKGTQYRVEAAMAKVNGQEIRPESLRNSNTGIIFRNKMQMKERNSQRSERKQSSELHPHSHAMNVTVDENDQGVPYWAQLPANRSKIK